jgi:NarL family two-component system response regulator LiaR
MSETELGGPEGTGQSAGSRYSVLVADPDPMTRGQLCQEIGRRPRLTLAGAAADSRHALALVVEHAPAVLLCELDLPPDGGAVLLGRIAAANPGVHRVVLTGNDDPRAWIEALRAGADGVVTKGPRRNCPGAAIDALETVLDGVPALEPQVMSALLAHIRRQPEPGPGLRPIRSPLTNREWEILELLETGMTTRAIAQSLVLSEDTVYSHIKNVFRKLDVHTRSAAVQAVVRLRAEARNDVADLRGVRPPSRGVLPADADELHSRLLRGDDTNGNG